MRVHYIQNDPKVTPGRIITWACQKDHTLTSTKIYEEYTFPTLDSFDLLIILGGHMGAYEQESYPWLNLEEQFIKETIAQNKFVLGICLGAQLIAQALGGKVYPHTHKEVGWWPIKLHKNSENNELMKGIPNEYTVLQFHADTFELPTCATLLASSYGCQNQLFSYGKHVIGMQFHPELTNEKIINILETYEYGDGYKGFMQNPEGIINQFALLKQLAEILFTLLDNMENLLNKRDGELSKGM
ncbi:type 1 glutamine amidotransferase [Priestia endophytica]|uniref:type 1 glutamine amidotransferase n=1 Tax=Priestia endophytica TaxID=135735 RepID=UPI000DCA3D05|nr:type 1 glutamine amidotransferase [Priestia endophytica]RAS85833.1 hypothetical protein A4U60_09010 [Priestia endophytica]